MKNNKRRLIKDLPFDGLDKGTVIWRGGRGHGGKYSISRGKTYYDGGGDSDNGITVFDDSVEEIIDLVWDNADWFEDAGLKHIDLVPVKNGLLLRFEPIDRDELEEFAKGLIHILPNLKEGSYSWNKFDDITARIKNT
jgi:hypothetical protein